MMPSPLLCFEEASKAASFGRCPRPHLNIRDLGHVGLLWAGSHWPSSRRLVPWLSNPHKALPPLRPWFMHNSCPLTSPPSKPEEWICEAPLTSHLGWPRHGAARRAEVCSEALRTCTHAHASKVPALARMRTRYHTHACACTYSHACTHSMQACTLSMRPSMHGARTHVFLRTQDGAASKIPQLIGSSSKLALGQWAAAWRNCRRTRWGTCSRTRRCRGLLLLLVISSAVTKLCVRR